jgi:hypothetical protein
VKKEKYIKTLQELSIDAIERDRHISKAGSEINASNVRA